MKRQFLSYVSRNVLSMVGLSLYILADTFFIANGVGTNGLVALNLTLPLYSLTNGFGLMLGIGGATRFSIARGEGSEAQARGILMQVCCAGAATGLLLTVLVWLFARPLMLLLGASPAVLPEAVTYLRTLFCFEVFFLLNNILVAFVRNDGAPGVAMAAMLTACMSNIALDYLLIYPCGLGMFGAAFATGLAPIFSMLVLLFHLCSKRSTLRFRPVPLSRKLLCKVIGAGGASFVNECSSGLVMLLFNFIILRLLGDVGVGAYGIISNIALVFISIFTGVSQGIQPLVSRSFGAGNHRDMRACLRYALWLVLGLGGFFYGMGTVLRENIILLFNRERDPLLQQIALEGIPLYFLAFLFMGVNIIAAGYLACTSRARASFAIALLRGLVLAAGFAAVLPLLFGMTGVWLAVPCAEAAALAVSLFLLRTEWRKARL